MKVFQALFLAGTSDIPFCPSDTPDAGFQYVQNLIQNLLNKVVQQ